MEEIQVCLYSLIGLFSSICWFGYAEIHYRLPGIPSRLFKKEPEIIFDLPHRGEMNGEIPLFLFIKDAHRFPAKLQSLNITITCPFSKRSTERIIDLDQTVQSRFFSRTFYIPTDYFPQRGKYEVTAELSYRIRGKQFRLKQDNYPSIAHQPFLIDVSDEALPSLPNLYWGDLHIHSNYTDDQLEFGAPIRETALCAKAMGLHFIAITDHSYDLDDNFDNCLENNASLKKWHHFLAEINAINREFSEFIILPGEEVSVGNYKNQNVHCLILGSRTFYPGRGDGGKHFLSNRPSLTLEQLFERVKTSSKNAIIAAAHPFDQPPYTQQIVLNRGYWHKTDLLNPALDYWQILNGRIDTFFFRGIKNWIDALLAGQRAGILGGTDAHGNFNCYRQITFPFLKMIKHREQLLGQTLTGVFSQKPLDQMMLLQKLKEKCVIVSNGPAASIEIIQNGKIYHIGDMVKSNVAFTTKISAVSNREFGYMKFIALYIGDCSTKKELIKRFPVTCSSYKYQHEIEFAKGLPSGYIRLEVHVERDKDKRFCLTNPIWLI